MLGLKHITVKLAPYSYKWSYLFQEEVLNLRRVLNNPTLQVEHVGSTALNTIAAKPILDIFIPCEDLAQALNYEEALATLGYTLVTDGAHYKLYIKGSEEARTHHLTFTSPDGDYWQETIQFRDYLLEHPSVAKAYEVEKIRLAETYATSRRNYSSNKARFIQGVLREIKSSVQTSIKAKFVDVHSSNSNGSPLSLLSTHVNSHVKPYIKPQAQQGITVTQSNAEPLVNQKENTNSQTGSLTT